LRVISKIEERVVDAGRIDYVNQLKLMPTFQSACRRFYSTETVAVSIDSSIIEVLNRGEVGALVLLDLSAAFSTVDHGILSDALQQRFSVSGPALSWLTNLSKDRHQSVTTGTSPFTDVPLIHGVPQRSVLGPKAFTMFAEDVAEIFIQQSMYYHLYADDMQGHLHCKPAAISRPGHIHTLELFSADPSTVGFKTSSAELRKN
jgi:hypothetical protein